MSELSEIDVEPRPIVKASEESSSCCTLNSRIVELEAMVKYLEKENLRLRQSNLQPDASSKSELLKAKDFQVSKSFSNCSSMDCGTYDETKSFERYYT